MRCGFHSLLARRKAPHNQRMQQTIPSANKFAAGLAPDPQRISPYRQYKDMTKRVRQHQLEDQSRLKFSLAIPRNWVCRDKDKDYGIDVEVEIFDNKGRATGLAFWVQLKATESNEESVIKKIDLSIESIKYYKSLDIPVLIARYSEIQDSFYCKWAQEIDLFFAKKNAKTIRISFNETDIWNEESPFKVKGFLKKIRAIKNGRFSLPIPVYLDVKGNAVNMIPKGVFVSSYRAALGEYSEFAVLKSEPKDALIEASLDGDELKISLCSLGGCTFHSIKKRDHERLAEGIVADTLIGLAIALAHVGQCEMAARIVFDNRLKERFVHKREILIGLIPYLLKTSYFGVAIDAVNDVIDSEEDNILEVVTSAAAIFEANPDDEEKSSKLEGFLKKCLEKYVALGLEPLIGVSHYNLGNHYRSRRLYQKSINHYLKARKYEKKYEDQAYYYQEIGGALFEYGKFYLSSILYKMALDKGAPESVKPLYADALMHNGKYQLALDVFSEYLKFNKEENDEWYLKMICLENLIESFGIKEQTRCKKEALAVINIKKVGEEGFIKSLESALEMDMLCGLAWFNLGIERSRAGNHEGAAFSFTICGLVQTWDIEAWVNAALCCFNKEVSIQILPLVLRTGFFFNGDRFLSKLYQDLYDKTDQDVCGQFANIIEEILPKNKNGKDKPAVRIMGEDGKFKDIFEGKKV